MDLVPYLSSVIMVATVATLILGVMSYAVFKMREHRRPRSGRDPVFFHRFERKRPDAAE